MEVRCATMALDEPLAGTAPVAAGWVCVEQRGSWPRDIARHPSPAVSRLIERAKRAGWRVLLMRRPGRAADPDAPLRVITADVAAMVATSFTIDGPDDLDGVAIEAGRGEVADGGLLMVCTHGRRDRCCAVDGRALAKAAAGAGSADVWECSHLGGHRFAPTALVLPTGYLYGRLDVESALSAAKAAGEGEMEAELCRGRSLWEPAGQLAELAVRAATGLRDAGALSVTAPNLVTAADGREWLVPIHERVGVTRPASCGAAALPRVLLEAGTPALLP
jgi:hypothetical protein